MMIAAGAGLAIFGCVLTFLILLANMMGTGDCPTCATVSLWWGLAPLIAGVGLLVYRAYR